jgi:hypothetical protein
VVASPVGREGRGIRDRHEGQRQHDRANAKKRSQTAPEATEVPEIGWGIFTVLAPGTPEVLALRYDWRNNAFVAVHNLGASPRKLTLKVETNSDRRPELVILLCEDHSHADDGGRHRILLEPCGYRWYRVGGLDYLLKRSEVWGDGRPQRSPRSCRMTPSAGRSSICALT